MFIETTSPCSYIWHKYRPVILRMMVDSETTPQHYAFADHEFKRLFPKNTGKLAFILFLHRAKAINNIKSSPLAQALLGILQQSKTVVRLTEESTYELMLDDKFVFHVRKNDPAVANYKSSNAVAVVEN